jgi:hypothetical protein
MGVRFLRLPPFSSFLEWTWVRRVVGMSVGCSGGGIGVRDWWLRGVVYLCTESIDSIQGWRPLLPALHRGAGPEDEKEFAFKYFLTGAAVWVFKGNN